MENHELQLRTSRLHLIAANAPVSRAAATDRGKLAEILDARIPDAWPPELLADHLEEFAEMFAKNPDRAGMSMWYWIRDDATAGDRVLIGNGGGGGTADDHGSLAIGYAVLDEFQRQGYATEAMRAIVDWMFDQPGVQMLTADTYPHLKPSIRVMEKLGMTFEGPGPEEGTIRYILRN